MAKEFYGYKATKEKIEVTFGGWDGRSYEGEGRKLTVWTSDRHPGVKFVKTANYGGTMHKVLDTKHELSGKIEVEYFWSIRD